MCSHVDQAFETILCEDEAAMSESLLSEVLRGYVGQSLASKAEVWQILRRDVVGDVYEELIGKYQELFGVLSVRRQSAQRWIGR